MEKPFLVRLTLADGRGEEVFQRLTEPSDVPHLARTWTEHGCFVSDMNMFIPARWISRVTWKAL